MKANAEIFRRNEIDWDRKVAEDDDSDDDENDDDIDDDDNDDANSDDSDSNDCHCFSRRKKMGSDVCCQLLFDANAAEK